jgi:predicted RNase H-like HicB family nuclease
MLTYRATYKWADDVVHGEVLDFQGAIAFGADLDEARRMLGSALVTMAETCLLLGEPLPKPDPTRSDPESDLEEPIYLLLSAASKIRIVPEEAVA